MIPLLRMRKITIGLVALSLFVAAPAAAAKSGPATFKGPKPSKGFADGHKLYDAPKGFADGHKWELGA